MINREQLSRLATIIVSSVDKKVVPGEMAVKLCNFTDVYHNWAITDFVSSDFMVASASKKEIGLYKVKKGQVAITKDSETRDDIGVSTYVADEVDAILGYHCALITPGPRLNGGFLNALLHTKYANKYFEANSSGSGQRFTLTDRSIGGFKVPLFDYSYQEKVGDFCNSVEKKIEINKLSHKEAFKLLRTIYDYWFIQFEFPDRTNKSYKSNGGKFEYSPLLKKDIPSGWKVAKLKDCCDILLGGTPSTEVPEYWGGNIPWLNSGEVASFPAVSTEEKITESGLKNSPAKLMKKGTVLISITGNIRCTFLGIDASANQSVVGVLENENLKKEYLYPFMADMVKRYTTVSGGNCQKHINKGEIQNTYILLPPNDLLKKYYSMTTPLYDLLVCNALENKDLIRMREKLLPLFASGQVCFK